MAANATCRRRPPSQIRVRNTPVEAFVRSLSAMMGSLYFFGDNVYSASDLGFVVFSGFVCFDVSVEGFDESQYLLWCGHIFLAFRFL